jgi:hypothetical protein
MLTAISHCPNFSTTPNIRNFSDALANRRTKWDYGLPRGTGLKALREHVRPVVLLPVTIRCARSTVARRHHASVVVSNGQLANV